MSNNNSFALVVFERLDSITLSKSKYLVTIFIDFSVYGQTCAIFLFYCHSLLHNTEDLTNNAYPKMMNLERDQNCLKTYTSFFFETGQECYSIYHSLNNTKLKFDSCLNHLTKPIISSEKLYPSFNYPDRVHHVKLGVIHKIFNFLFGKSSDSTTLNKGKQNNYLSKENQLMQ